jgi:hypothetical protein
LKFGRTERPVNAAAAAQRDGEIAEKRGQTCTKTRQSLAISAVIQNTAYFYVFYTNMHIMSDYCAIFTENSAFFALIKPHKALI